MRLVLHNPHAESHYGNTLSNYLNRIYSFRKYKYLLDFLVEFNKPIVIFYDTNSSSLPPYFSKYIPRVIEICLWAFINNINPLRLHITNNIQTIRDDDIFFSFTLHNLDKENISLGKIKYYKFIKIFHLTHFVSNTSIIAKNLEKLKVDFLIAENNLSRNSKYFQKLFPLYKKDVYYLPYVFQSRFKKTTNFKFRKNKCIATGTLIQVSEMVDYKNQFKDFLNFYKTDMQHPMRSQIYENKNELSSIIDSYITPFWETKRKESKSSDNKIRVWLNRAYNALYASRRKYLKFNIVEKYNQYRMFIVPEEINDLPGISFVEGMACGSAYIGKINAMYTDLGLISGVHYIGYNGTLDDLKRKIIYYQKHTRQLEKIAQNGYEYVTKKFNGNAVASKFWKDLEELAEKYKKNNYNSNVLKFKADYI